MIDTPAQSGLYRSHFDALEKRLATNSCAWLRPLRSAAMDRFEELGFPTIKNEEWRFTSVKPIASTPFSTAAPNARVTPEMLSPLTIRGAAALMVFVDGYYRPELSHVKPIKGLGVTTLAEEFKRHGDRLVPLLGQYADAHGDAFTALNTAMIEDGVFVQIDQGVTAPGPIHLLHISTDQQQPWISHPRNLIVVEDRGTAEIVEHYAAFGEGVYFSNAVTEMYAGKGSNVSHYLVDEESPRAFNVSTLRVNQNTESSFESHSALVGGAIVRNNVHVELIGEHCKSLVNGLFVGNGRQHMDNHMRVVHAQPHGDSRQFYKGILSDHAHGVFTGRIVVRPNAQKTDAKQTNRNLLLSDDAQIDTRPQLEIFADDVKCTHGATTGRLDEEAIFYLQARGIDRQTARGLLIYAFARESIDRMRIEPLRHRLERQLVKRMPDPAMLEALVEPAVLVEA